jgi:hypothetical protein
VLSHGQKQTEEGGMLVTRRETRMTALELMGWAAGVASSPATGLLSALRRSRMFHPSGLLCRADVEPLPALSAGAAEVAERLAGPALVRWSSALWKRGEWIDVLGCGIRFSQAPLRVEPQAADQDLLLATIQRPWSMALSPFTTQQHDFLANAYFCVSPFHVAPLGRIEWRLSPEPGPRVGATRRERLANALAAGASCWLEWAPYAGPLRRPAATFSPLVRLRLVEWLDLDQQALRFDPFRAGRGLVPVGFVHALRRATYSTSQALRPSREQTPLKSADSAS